MFHRQSAFKALSPAWITLSSDSWTIPIPTLEELFSSEFPFGISVSKVSRLVFEVYLKKLVILLLLIAVTAGTLSAWLMGELLGVFLYALPVLFSFFKIPGFRLKFSSILLLLFCYSFALSFFVGGFVAMLLALHYLSLLVMKEAVLMGEYG